MSANLCPNGHHWNGNPSRCPTCHWDQEDRPLWDAAVMGKRNPPQRAPRPVAVPFQPMAYAIERAVFVGRDAHLFERRDGMVVADQRAVANIVADLFGIDPPDVVRRRGRPSTASWARPKDRRIAMGATAGPAIVCHEVAHLLADPKATGEPWHGRTWATFYVTAVDHVIGHHQATRLRAAFDAHSTTRSITP